MEKSTRMRLAVGATICGVLAAIGWAVAVYASTNSPEIHEVVVKAANGGQSTHSKITFLFAPAVYQTFTCLILLNPLIRWKRLVRKAAERAAPKDLWTEATIGRYRFSTVVTAVTIAFCVASGMSLYWVVAKAGYLLGKWQMP